MEQSEWLRACLHAPQRCRGVGGGGRKAVAMLKPHQLQGASIAQARLLRGSAESSTRKKIQK